MVKSVKSRNGLRRYRGRGDSRRLPLQFRRKIAAFMEALDEADLPGSMQGVSGLHRLSGDLAGYWAVTDSNSLRIWFRFEGGGVWDVTLGDCH